MPQRQVSPKQAPRTEGNESQGKMAGKQEKTSLKNVVPTKVYFAKYQMDANREKILDLIPSYLLGRYSKERIDVYGNCIKQELISGEGLSTKKRDMLKALVYIKLFNNKADIRDKARRTLRKIIILEKLQDTYKTKQMDFCVRKFEKYFNDPKNRVIFHLKHVEVIEDMELINILLNTIKNDPDKLVRHAAVCTLSETVPTTKIRMGPIIRSLIHATSDPEEKVRVQATKTLCTLLTRRELKGKLTVKLATEITERLFEIIKNETETTKLRGVAFQSLYEIIKHTDLELDFKDIFNKLLEVTDKLISLKQGKKTCQVLRYLQTKKKCPFPEEMRRALTDEYNIKFFDRYNPLTLEEMYRSIDRKHKEQTFAVCVAPKSDHTGAFDYYSVPLGLSLGGKGINVRVVEVGNEIQFLKLVEKMAEKYGKIDLLIISGHGWSAGTQFGYLPEIGELDITDRILLKKLKKCLNSGAQIIMSSCSTGSKFLWVFPGIAQTISKITGATVFAPVESSSLAWIECEKNVSGKGKVIEVAYYGVETAKFVNGKQIK